MADLTNYLESALAAHVFDGSAFTQPTAWFVKLHTGDPGEDATANAATEDTRIEITSFTGTNPRSNGNELLWEDVSTTETITHISVWDAVSTGNPLMKGDLAASRALSIGDNLRIAVGELDLSFD